MNTNNKHILLLMTIKAELSSKGFNLYTNNKTKEYTLLKKKNYIDKIIINETELFSLGAIGAIEKYNNLIHNEEYKSLIKSKILAKNIYELNIYEFEKLIELDNTNIAVKELYKIFWDNLSDKEKKSISELINSSKSIYSSIPEFIFQKYLQSIDKFQYRKNEILEISDGEVWATRNGRIRYTRWLYDHNYIDKNNKPLKCIKCNHIGYEKTSIEVDELGNISEFKAICPNCKETMGYNVSNCWELK